MYLRIKSKTDNTAPTFQLYSNDLVGAKKEAKDIIWASYKLQCPDDISMEQYTEMFTVSILDNNMKEFYSFEEGELNGN